MGIFRRSKSFTNFSDNSGFTLIELMIVIAIIGTLAGIAIPNYIGYRNRAIMVRCISEIKLIEKGLILYNIQNYAFPDSLNDIGLGNLRDPWNRPYEYLRYDGPKTKKLRKDRSLHPVNTDFDLYSRGPDGKTAAPFTAEESQDDIVRANNGQYLGPVSGY